MTIEVRPMTIHGLPDARSVLTGPRGRDACWCQRFLRHESADNQTAFEAEINSASDPIGLLAYRDAQPVGWSRVAPRTTLPGVMGNRALRKVFENDSFDGDAAWWVTCFVVQRAHRGHGVGVALLRAAVDFAREGGAAVLDGHPVDTGRLQSRPSPAALFTGTQAMFDATGFSEIARTYRSRPVMRRTM